MFVRDRTKPSGFHSFCKECRKKHSSKMRGVGYSAQWDRDNAVEVQLKKMVSRSRVRAAQRNLRHDIDLDYLRSIRPTHCPYLGIKLRWELRVSHKSGPCPASPSLDRIDSSKGYVKDNVVIVSHRANSIKNDATEQELFRIGRALSLLKAERAFPEWE